MKSSHRAENDGDGDRPTDQFLVQWVVGRSLIHIVPVISIAELGVGARTIQVTGTLRMGGGVA